MSLPAVIWCETDPNILRIAGLPLVERLIVAANRAGATPITVVSAWPLPRMRRVAALKISWLQTSRPVPAAGATLVLSNRVLVLPADLRRLLGQGGRLVTSTGEDLPVGVVPAFTAGAPDEQLAGAARVTAAAVASPAGNVAEAAAAGRHLWASLSSPADGQVDRYLNRPIGRWLSKALVHTPFTPNQVSLAAIALGLAGAAGFAQGRHLWACLGALCFQISAIVDCVDGELARVRFQESDWGKWLDIVGDQVVHIALFLGLGIGLYRTGASTPVLVLAASCALGVVISFAVIVRSQLQPKSRFNPRLQELIDSATNRDFSVLLLILTVCDRRAWFLWGAAIGVHVFWILALFLQLAQRPPRSAISTDLESRA